MLLIQEILPRKRDPPRLRQGKALSGRRPAYLLREAEDETREALQPYGYYSPTIAVERTRGENITELHYPQNCAPHQRQGLHYSDFYDADKRRCLCRQRLAPREHEKIGEISGESAKSG